MKKTKDSQRNMYPHSEVKVELLRIYLEKYFLVLGHSSQIKKVYVYDLFCGPGIYENKKQGSPLVILNEILKVLEKGVCSEAKFECLFNDTDAERILILRDCISKSSINQKNIDTCYSCKDYEIVIDEVIRKNNSLGDRERSFIFIDPFQYKNIRFKDIESLLSTKKTEVLLFLPTQFMFRFESNGTPQSLKSFIEELVPYDEWPISITGIDFIYSLKEHFKWKLGSDFYIDTFIIQRDVNQYFCLFFFTSHIYGFEKMLEAKWDIDEKEGRGWALMDEDDLFSCVDIKHSATIKFENDLRCFLSEKWRTNKDIYEFVLHSSHLPKHANQILKSWQNKGALIVQDKNGNPAKKGAFYLNYTDRCYNPQKISVRINK